MSRTQTDLAAASVSRLTAFLKAQKKSLIRAANVVVLAIVAATAVYASLITAPGRVGLIAAAFALVMLAIALIDGESFLIPNWLNAVGAGLALLAAAMQQTESPLLAVGLATARGATLAFAFFLLRLSYARLRGREGLGLGDVKLAFVAGAWLDWVMIPIAVEIAALAAITVYLMRQFFLHRRPCVTNRLPFGLFFAPAIWLCWVCELRFLPPF